MEGCTHAPCVAHCLDSLVGDFLCHRHSVQIILGTAGAIRSHFQGSVEARRLLPAAQPFLGLSDPWVSACHLLERLVERQRLLQGYEERQPLGRAGAALSAALWSPAGSLVKLLQPFWMVVREASTHGPP